MLMPPNRTVGALTFGSSTSVGVYTGCSVTSWPRASNSAASALSRRQLPQYIPAAPAVMKRIFIRSGSHRRGLQRARAVQEIDDIAFVGLEPVQPNRGDRAEIEAIDMRRVEERAAQFGFLRDGGADERRS